MSISDFNKTSMDKQSIASHGFKTKNSSDIKIKLLVLAKKMINIIDAKKKTIRICVFRNNC